MIDERDALGGSAFIIVRVVADQDVLAEVFFGRVVINRQEFRKNALAHFARERLAFVDVLLAEALGAMAEDFVEENGGGAARQESGPV